MSGPSLAAGRAGWRSRDTCVQVHLRLLRWAAGERHPRQAVSESHVRSLPQFHVVPVCRLLYLSIGVGCLQMLLEFCDVLSIGVCLFADAAGVL